MSKEKGCKCCKQIWYVDMLEKRWGLCPNCYEYCKPLIDNLKIKDKKISDLQHRLGVAEKALEMAVDIANIKSNHLWTIEELKEKAEREVKGE